MNCELTVEALAQGETYRDRKSRFLGWAMPVASVEEARARVAEWSQQYRDARHVCWACVAGSGQGQTATSSDNGEPSGTAGRPILGQIRSAGLTDVLVIVVRYFGGILLGTPGLIAAYKGAARAAIDAATIVERREMVTLRLAFPYLSLNDVMRRVKASGAAVLEQSFDNDCSLTLSLPLDAAEALRSQLEKFIIE